MVCGLVAQRLNEECVLKTVNGADSLWGNKLSHRIPQTPQHRLASLCSHGYSHIFLYCLSDNLWIVAFFCLFFSSIRWTPFLCVIFKYVFPWWRWKCSFYCRLDLVSHQTGFHCRAKSNLKGLPIICVTSHCKNLSFCSCEHVHVNMSVWLYWRKEVILCVTWPWFLWLKSRLVLFICKTFLRSSRISWHKTEKSFKLQALPDWNWNNQWGAKT